MQDFSSVAFCCKKKNPVDVDVEGQVVEHVYRCGFTWGAASFEGLNTVCGSCTENSSAAMVPEHGSHRLSHLSGTSTKSESRT